MSYNDVTSYLKRRTQYSFHRNTIEHGSRKANVINIRINITYEMFHKRPSHVQQNMEYTVNGEIISSAASILAVVKAKILERSVTYLRMRSSLLRLHEG